MIKIFACVFVLVSILAPLANAAGGTFTVNCHSLTIQRSDPILQPGTPGGHLHAVIGGNAFRRSMPGMFDARSANATTCDKAKDHSNYWVPYMYHHRPDGQFEMVKWDHAAVYYQKRACNYSETTKACDSDNFPQLAFPDGFRMLAGNPFFEDVQQFQFRTASSQFLVPWWILWRNQRVPHNHLHLSYPCPSLLPFLLEWNRPRPSRPQEPRCIPD